VLKGRRFTAKYKNLKTPQNRRDYNCYYNAANQTEYATEPALAPTPSSPDLQRHVNSSHAKCRIIIMGK
jgi:hypothetical protein